MNILEPKLLILASAGSGKTFQLVNRVIGLAAGGKNQPESIVALTFTRKAAGEFADSVLRRLAKAASDPVEAEKLAADIGVNDVDFGDLLKRFVEVLPKLTFGTMDSFFAGIVRSFQYELGLTGGNFDLLEGARAEAARESILAEILGDDAANEVTEEFLHAFRRATTGRENVMVLEPLREFIAAWHRRFRSGETPEWGPAFLSAVPVDAWEREKHALAEAVRRGMDGIGWTRKGQDQKFAETIDQFTGHTIGSGSLGSPAGLLASIFEAAASGGAMEVKHYKPFLVPGPAGEALRRMALLAALCEMSAALARTHAIRHVVSVFDSLCETRLRRKGMLGFDDVKELMGEWVSDGDAHARRQLVDFRLGATYHHWLLDEFQDTSRPDWNGLKPLVDEAAGTDGDTVFIVGDRKQAIYGWRGGEVRLFDEVAEHYTPLGLVTSPMSDSWRSCPEVLQLVNRVCGDSETISRLFGHAASRWQWEDHVSAAPLTAPEKRGCARAEIAGDWDERLERLEEILNHLGVGRRDMTCGVLVRNNKQVHAIADFLRQRGFDVIEDGEREPASDSPVGVVLASLLRWLADPSDAFSRQTVAMSPLAAVIAAKYGGHWQAAWEGLLADAAEHGFAAMTERLIREQASTWSAFGKRRAGDILSALAGYDARGGCTPREAADWIDRLKVSQSPGAAAVQIMTIHKSKGLGFDVVILPDISKDGVASATHYEAATGDGWISDIPPKWARGMIPEMIEAERRWADRQAYEAMCMLYVAITRSKRGLYVLLEPPSEKQEEDRASLANWLTTSLDLLDGPFQAGDDDWMLNVPLLGTTEMRSAPLPLGQAVPRRDRTTPSGTKAEGAKGVGSIGGMKYGSELHAAFEATGWIDEQQVRDARISALIKNDRIADLFRKRGREVTLLREQRVEAIVEGKWLSGAIDRLHLHRDGAGAVSRIEIIDFKTDVIASADELIARYAGQMEAYRRVMKEAWPAAEVECLLVSTALGEVVPV